MQPDNNTASSGGPDYGFIFNDGQKAKKGFSFPRLNIPKPVAIGLLVIVFFLILLTILSLRSGSLSPLFSVGARQTEILRVSSLASSNIKDPQNQSLISTVVATFSSAQKQSADSLGVKTTDSRFNTYQNKNIDSQLITAGQNGNYDTTYLTYLKQALSDYEQNIQASLSSASPSVKNLLEADLADAQNLLDSPQLKNL